MKMFVFIDAYDIKWGDGVVVAVAKNKEDAINVILKAQQENGFSYHSVSRKDLQESAVIVKDLPCAYAYTWEE